MHTRISGCVLLLVLSLTLTSRDGWAHHSFTAEFDPNLPIKFTGTVSKVEWINPHIWIHVDVKKADGSVDRWRVEGGAPNALMRRGMTKTTVKPGMEVVVDGFKSRDGSPTVNGMDLFYPNGEKLFVGLSGGPGNPPDPR